MKVQKSIDYYIPEHGYLKIHCNNEAKKVQDAIKKCILVIILL